MKLENNEVKLEFLGNSCQNSEEYNRVLLETAEILDKLVENKKKIVTASLVTKLSAPLYNTIVVPQKADIDLLTGVSKALKLSGGKFDPGFCTP